MSLTHQDPHGAWPADGHVAHGGARWLTEADVIDLLTLEDAIDVLERAYRANAATGAEPMRRAHARHDDAIVHAVGGIAIGSGVAGVKSWLYTPAGASPLLLVWDLSTGALLGVVEAFRMGQWRTAATSGLATRVLARPDADVLALLGTGKQAHAQAHAVAAVRPLRRVQVFGRDRSRLDAFCDDLAVGLGVDVSGTTEPGEALRDASIVTAITRAAEPFVTGEMIAAGAHINAVGAIVPSRRELETSVVARCDAIVADSTEQAREDSGELIAAVDEGALSWSQVLPLHRVVVDPACGRPHARAITLFKALGAGLSDVALGVELLERAVRAGVGTALPVTLHAHRSQPSTSSPRSQANA